MADGEKTNVTESTDISKDKKSKKNDKRKSIVEHYRDYKSEFDKIIWPNKKELAKQTITVIVTSLFLGAIVFVIDSLYSLIYNLLVQNLGNSTSSSIGSSKG